MTHPDPELNALRASLDSGHRATDIAQLAAAFDTARAELAAGDLDAHPRAVNAGLKLAAATQRAMTALDDDLYRAQRDKVAAADHNRR